MPIRHEDKHRYPPDWDEISDRIRFVRAGGRCECDGECGRGHDGRCPNRHGEPEYSSGRPVVLTTAHLDQMPEHNDDENLRAMCPGCHLHYDRRYRRDAALAEVMDPLFPMP